MRSARSCGDGSASTSPSPSSPPPTSKAEDWVRDLVRDEVPPEPEGRDPGCRARAGRRVLRLRPGGRRLPAVDLPRGGAAGRAAERSHAPGSAPSCARATPAPARPAVGAARRVGARHRSGVLRRSRHRSRARGRADPGWHADARAHAQAVHRRPVGDGHGQDWIRALGCSFRARRSP